MMKVVVELIKCCLLLMVAGALLGCATAEAPEQVSSGTLSGGMLGLGGEDHRFWEQWTRREPSQMSVSDVGAVTVFDVWSVEDERYRERLWDSTFHLLTSVQMGLPEGMDEEGLKSIMMRFSGELERARFDLAFFTEDDGKSEGVVLRIVEPGGSGLWIEGARRARSSMDPYRWTLRVEPGFEEAPGFALWWEEIEGQWEVAVASGAGARRADASEGEAENTADFLELWRDHLWRVVIERAYIEPSFERSEVHESEEELARGWPAALGMKPEERGLGNFVNDSVFWPRTMW